MSYQVLSNHDMIYAMLKKHQKPVSSKSILYPICSMVLVYLPTWLGDFGQGQMLGFIFQHHGLHMGYGFLWKSNTLKLMPWFFSSCSPPKKSILIRKNRMHRHVLLATGRERRCCSWVVGQNRHFRVLLTPRGDPKNVRVDIEYAIPW